MMRPIGYELYLNFLTGTITNSTKLTWEGIHNNLTYIDLQDILINSNYSDLKVTNGVKEKIFIMPYGYCHKVHVQNNSEPIIFKMKEQAKLILVDPYLDNRIRLKESSGLTFISDFTSTNIDEFDLKFFKLTYKLYDSSILDGLKCRDYR